MITCSVDILASNVINHLDLFGVYELIIYVLPFSNYYRQALKIFMMISSLADM